MTLRPATIGEIVACSRQVTELIAPPHAEEAYALLRKTL